MLINRGNALLQLSRAEEALATFDRVLEIYPDHAVTLSSRGAALKLLGRYEEALRALAGSSTSRPTISRRSTMR